MTSARSSRRSCRRFTRMALQRSLPMASALYLSPLTFIVQYFTNVGVIAAGASVQTNLAGTVSTQQTTYTDSTGLVPNANPLTLNSAARAAAASGALTAFWQP